MISLQAIDASVVQWASGLGMPLEALLRLTLAAVCGGLVGLEREVRGRQAGFRTNLLVCVGSAMVMIVSTALATLDWPSATKYGVQISTDPGRIAYGVMGGIGFLGAGTIIHNKGSIRGLTTAAAMWCVAAIGLGAGMGLYVVTVMATAMVFLALWLLNYVERLVPQTRYRHIIIRMPWKAGCVREAVDHMKSRGFKVVDASFDRRDSGDSSLITLQLAFTHSDRYYDLEREMAEHPSMELLSTRELQV